MDLSSYSSLRPCSAAELYEQLQQAQEELVIYVEKIDPDVYSDLNIEFLKTTQFILSKKVLRLAPEHFMALFHRVFFESFQMEIDVKREMKVKYKKFVCLVMIIALSLLFIQPIHSFTVRGLLFSGIVALCVCLYILLNHRALVKVSNIKKHFHFKVMKDGFLDVLPSLYIVDQRVFIGTNLFISTGHQDFYEVESEEVKQQIKSVYEEYVNSHQPIGDELLIAQYIDLMHPNDFLSVLK